MPKDGADVEILENLGWPWDKLEDAEKSINHTPVVSAVDVWKPHNIVKIRRRMSLLK